MHRLVPGVVIAHGVAAFRIGPLADVATSAAVVDVLLQIDRLAVAADAAMADLVRAAPAVVAVGLDVDALLVAASGSTDGNLLRGLAQRRDDVAGLFDRNAAHVGGPDVDSLRHSFSVALRQEPASSSVSARG